MEKKSSLFVILGYLFFIIPNLIFFIGWCNTPTAIVCSLVLIYGFYYMCKNAPEIWFPNSRKERILLLAVFFISFLWVYFSGIGTFSFQNYDHSYRNEIYALLVDRPWPVVIDKFDAILSYYIGFWMPAAVLAKINGELIVGYFVQLIWATMGVFLFFYYILSTLKKKALWVIALFIFFSGMDILGLYFFNKVKYATYFLGTHIDSWFPFHQFSCFTTQLFWVFNQALPAWVFAGLLLVQKNNKNILFLFVCLLLFSTLPSFGFVPFVLYFCLKNGKENSDILKLSHLKESISSIFSLPNIFALVSLFPVLFLYLSQNYTTARVGISPDILYSFSNSIPNSIFGISLFWRYVQFFILEVGVILFCLFFFQRKNPLLYLVCLSLLSTIFFKIGFETDFKMRVSIPALIFLYYLVVKTIQESDLMKHKIISVILLASLVIGAITPLSEFKRTLDHHFQDRGELKAKTVDITYIPANLNFFGNIKNSKFIKYFSRKIKN